MESYKDIIVRGYPVRRVKSSFLHHISPCTIKYFPSKSLEDIRLQGVFNEKGIANVVWFMKEGM